MPPTLLFEFNVFDPTKGHAPVTTIRKEFDVNNWEVFSQAELAVIEWGKEVGTLALGEAVKKKKRLWFLSLWNRIKPW